MKKLTILEILCSLIFMLSLIISCQPSEQSKPSENFVAGEVYFGDIRDYIDTSVELSSEYVEIYRKHGITKEMLEHPHLMSEESVEQLEKVYHELLSIANLEEIIIKAEDDAKAKGLLDKTAFYIYIEGPVTIIQQSMSEVIINEKENDN